MYPISILPVWMQNISIIFPIRWALQVMQASFKGESITNVTWQLWGLSLVISLAFWTVSLILDGKVHDMIRKTGEMSSI
jgi:ABC-type multidrug transport system permease subunit